MNSAVRTPVRWSTVLALVLMVVTAYWSLQYLVQQWTVVRGHSHDFFIPIIAGDAVEQQGIGHPHLHSPFGIIYFFLSSNSYRLLMQFPAWISLDKIHMLSTFQWLGVLLVLFLAFRFLQAPPRRLSLWYLAVLLLICVQPRNFDSSSPLPTWYASYNLHLWCLLMLQAANHYCWRRAGPAVRRAAMLGFLEALVLVLAFNYKVSFFVAASGLSLLPLWYLPDWQARFSYYGSLVASAVVMTAALAGLGADYAFYLADLAHAAQAKQIPPYMFILQASVMALYIAVCGWMEGGASMPAAGQGFLLRVFRRFAFHGVAGAAMLVAALGDFYAPTWPNVLLALWVAVCDLRVEQRTRPLLVAGAAAGWIGLLVLNGANALELIATADAVTEVDAAFSDEVIRVGPMELRLRFDTTRPSFHDLYGSGLLAAPADLADNMFRFSYRGMGDVPDSYNGTISETSEQDYPREVNATADWLSRNGAAAKGELVIAHLGFVNPWPLLTGNRMPDNALHWVHPGTTISQAQAPEFFESLRMADVAVIPLLKNSLPRDFAFSCAFYLWNLDRGGLFVPQHLVGSNLITVRKGGRLSADLPSPIHFDESDLRTVCRERLADFAARAQ